jgi:hypothetical protein
MAESRDAEMERERKGTSRTSEGRDAATKSDLKHESDYAPNRRDEVGEDMRRSRREAEKFQDQQSEES